MVKYRLKLDEIYLDSDLASWLFTKGPGAVVPGDHSRRSGTPSPTHQAH